MSTTMRRPSEARVNSNMRSAGRGLCGGGALGTLMQTFIRFDERHQGVGTRCFNSSCQSRTTRPVLFIGFRELRSARGNVLFQLLEPIPAAFARNASSEPRLGGGADRAE